MTFSTHDPQYLQANVKPERVNEVASFHVHEKSHKSDRNGNLIGIVIYDYEGQREFNINGRKIKEGDIFFASPESLRKNPYPGPYHRKLLSEIIGVEGMNSAYSMTVSGFARRAHVWERTSRSLNSKEGEHYTPDRNMHMSDYEFQRVIKHVERFLKSPPASHPQLAKYNELTAGYLNVSQSISTPKIVAKKAHPEHHPVLEIYHDLMHIRDHSLLHAYIKEVPKHLRLPVVHFLVAMSANQHSKHQVRDAVIDMSVENTSLATLGLAIGNTPAGIAMLTSHLAELGLKYSPSWEKIDAMPKSTKVERYAYSRMIEARATAELIALPSKTARMLSNSIKTAIDIAETPKPQHENLTIKPERSLRNFSVPQTSKSKFKDLEQSSFTPYSHLLKESTGVVEPVNKPMILTAASANFQPKPLEFSSKFKFNLCEPKSILLSNIPTQPSQHIKFSPEFKLVAPKTYWDTLAASRELPRVMNRQSQSFESSSSALASTSLFGKSKGLSQFSPPTAWDRMREQGVQHFSRKFTNN